MGGRSVGCSGNTEWVTSTYSYSVKYMVLKLIFLTPYVIVLLYTFRHNAPIGNTSSSHCGSDEGIWARARGEGVGSSSLVGSV